MALREAQPGTNSSMKLRTILPMMFFSGMPTLTSAQRRLEFHHDCASNDRSVPTRSTKQARRQSATGVQA
jgi:hypothetical protein